MGIHIAPAAVADFHQVLTDHSRYRGERDLRSLHLLALVQSLGFDTKVVDDYNGPGRAMAVFHRDLPLDVSRP